ncbi:glycoside hydrolase family 5 protein [Bradyrhizobium liaoningense]|uniref:glycoside hydrolase family 5 protein n=1 Tax=Bradyrhizobium liaoningense TaxID=43992 RepID=UPI001BA7A544|nr:glycoside hydrolase family 5 protein [Bradyrhizobium liaoningense]MBR0737671.1 glycoside hydrolase family 5 protein [Bradyrhizobium liaoningense]
MELGINLTGADYGLFPTESEIDYFASKGMSTVRLQVSWENLQPAQNGPLDPTFIQRLESIASCATAKGQHVIIDVHNYGYGYGNLIGTEQTPISSFADLWGKLAGVFADNPNIVFGLMNEPQLQSADIWLSAVNAAIASIRANGAISQEVLVPGLYWDGAFSWTTSTNATVLGAPGAIVDSCNNYAFEVHQYLDDTSGQNSWVVSETIGVERLEAITAWARDSGAKLFLGEFGVANNPAALTALDNMLAYMSANDDVWQGGTYWAAGPSWNDYMFSVEPGLGILDQAQMAILQKYTGAHFVRTILSNGETQVDTLLDGIISPTITDIYDASGHFTSRTIFDAEGNARKTIIAHSDGTYELTTFHNSESPSTKVIQIFDNAKRLLQETSISDDGSKVVQLFDELKNATSIETYSSDGSLSTRLINEPGGAHVSNEFKDGVVTSRTIYDSQWSFISRTTYEDNGNVSTVHHQDAQGNNVIDEYDATGMYIAVKNIYSTTWTDVSHTYFDASGHITKVQKTLESGDHEISLYRSGSDIPTQIEIFNSDWQLSSRTSSNLDNTYLTTKFVHPGSPQVISTEVYDRSWSLISRSTYSSRGELSSIETVLETGQHQISHYDDLSNISHVDLFAGNGQLLQRTHYNSAGVMTDIDHLLSNGDHIVYTFDGQQTGHLVSSATYNSSWALASRTTFDAAGHVISILEEQQDGSHVLATYLTAQQTPSTIDVFDQSWRLTERFQLDSSGAVTAIDHINPDNSHTVETFEPGSDKVQKSELYDSNWQLVDRTEFDDRGFLFQTLKENPNGTHTVANFLPGLSSPTTIDTFNANWQITERQQIDSFGRVIAIDHVSIDGSHVVDQVSNDLGTWTTTVFDSSWKELSMIAHNGLEGAQAAGLLTSQSYLTGVNSSSHSALLDNLVSDFASIWLQTQTSSQLLYA